MQQIMAYCGVALEVSCERAVSCFQDSCLNMPTWNYFSCKLCTEWLEPKSCKDVNRNEATMLLWVRRERVKMVTDWEKRFLTAVLGLEIAYMLFNEKWEGMVL